MSSDDRDCKDVVTPSTRGFREGIWSERLVVCLLIACSAAVLNLIIALHRRPSIETTTEPIKPEPIAAAHADVGEAPEPKPAPEVVEAVPVPAPTPVEPPVDPTKQALAELEVATNREREAASAADQKTASLEKTRQAMVAEAERWKRRESLIRSQISSLSKKAEDIDRQVGHMELERDVLARERDSLKSALVKSNRQSSFAVLPFKGANGTWQRPIILECSNGTVTLQPRGLTFSMLDLNPLVHPKASIVVQAIAREISVLESAGSPDGSPVVPYLVFMVRPDGIRPYYEARSRLEPLGIAFGYELIPQGLKVEYPDLSDLSTWDGTLPLDVAPNRQYPEARGGITGNGSDVTNSPGELTIEGFAGSSRPGQSGSRTGGQGNGSTVGDDPSDFIWPSRPGGGREYGMGALNQPSTTRGSRSGGSAGSLASTGGQGSGGSGGFGSSGVYPTPGDGSTDRSGMGAGSLGRTLAGSPGGFPGSGTTRGRGLREGSTFSPGGGTPGDSGELDSLVGQWSGGGLPRSPSFEMTPTPSSETGSGSIGDTESGAGKPGSVLGSASRSQDGASGSEFGKLGENGFSSGGEKPSQGLGSAGETGGQRSRRDLFGSTINPRGGNSSGGRSAIQAGGSGAPGTANSGDGRGTRGGTSVTASTSSSSATATQGEPGDVEGSLANELADSGLKPSLLGSGTAGSSGGNGSSTPSASTSGSRMGSGASASTDRPALSLGSSDSSRSSGSPPSGFGFGLPSSLSPSSSTSGSGMRGMASGGSSGSASVSSSSSETEEAPFLPTPDNVPKPPLKIEVPFEVVLDCQRDGIEILPGGNRVTAKTLKAAASSKDKAGQDLLSLHLKALERKRALVDPMIRPVPRIKFIVEQGGDETYLAVRRQLLFSGLDWPMTVQLVEGQASRFFNRELW